MSDDLGSFKFGEVARSCFFLDNDFAHLNHGSFGSIPIPVHNACNELSKVLEKNPDLFMRHKFYDQVNATREIVADLIGAPVETCVFVPNVATGINTVLRNLGLSSKDTVILSDASFESVSLAVKALDSTPHISTFSFNFPLSHSSILEKFREHIRFVKNKVELQTKGVQSHDVPKVLAIIDSIVSLPALLLPWKEMVRICRSEGVWTIVDAAHSIGQEMNLNVSDVDPDFWVTNCSKWLYAKRGCAVLYVPLRNQEMIVSTVIPPLIYHCPGIHPSSFIWKFYWSGMVDPVPVLSVEFAAKFRKGIGGEGKINEYCHALAISGGRLVAEILGTSIIDSTEVPGELTANMVNIELPLPSSIIPSKEIHFKYQEEMFEKYKVFASLFYFVGRWWVRASAQIYNDISDFERLGTALMKFCQDFQRA